MEIYSDNDPKFADAEWIPVNEDIFAEPHYDNFMMQMLTAREAYTRAHH